MTKKAAILIRSGLLTGLILLSMIPCIYAGDMNAGIILADDQGRVIYAQNKEKRFVPASTLKILTSLAALHILGKAHHFPTHYDYDGASKNLYIKGYGDPLLTSEIIEDLSQDILLQGRILLSQQQSDLYPGLLLKHFLEQKIPVTGSVQVQAFALKTTDPHVFQSPHELKTIIQSLLQYSNNFIANQLLLSMGAKLFGEPATLEKGVQTVQDFSRRHLGLTALTIDEGSGLSRGNRISPDEMLKILAKFMPYHGLLKHEENEFFKTGTLTGVRTRAGDLSGKNERLYPYIILVNEENTGYEFILTRLKNRVNQLKDK